MVENRFQLVLREKALERAEDSIGYIVQLLSNLSGHLKEGVVVEILCYSLALFLAHAPVYEVPAVWSDHNCLIP